LKILIAGDWAWHQYEQAFADALRELGHEVVKLATPRNPVSFFDKLESALSLPGFSMLANNIGLLVATIRKKPDVVLLWRATFILPITAALVARMSTLATYNNDDPFGWTTKGRSAWRQRLMWRHYLKVLPFAKVNFFYRETNVAESMVFGSGCSRILMPYFIPDQHVAVAIQQDDFQIYEADISFIGHYEPDGRDYLLVALAEAGLNVRVWGPSNWNSASAPGFSERFPNIMPAYGADYAKAVAASKVCLGFLSKINRDLYTRRCFEIPAMGKPLLVERTSELEKLFKEDVEMCFFDNAEDLVFKATSLVSEPTRLNSIGQAALIRSWSSGYDVVTRAEAFVRDLEGFED
jgi:spore maturation protein CgeB